MIERLEGRTLNSTTAMDVDLSTAPTLPEAEVTVTAESTSQTSLLKLMGEILSNVSKTRSEISMTFARNARA
jgi:hypothetical protein